MLIEGNKHVYLNVYTCILFKLSIFPSKQMKVNELNSTLRTCFSIIYVLTLGTGNCLFLFETYKLLFVCILYNGCNSPKSLNHNLEKRYAGPPHGLTINQVSAQSDVNCRSSYSKTKRFTDGWTDTRTDAETRYLNIIYIAVKFHNDIPTGNLVIECTRIAIQAAIVEFSQRALTQLKIIGA